MDGKLPRGYNKNDLKQLKAELAELLEQDAKRHKLNVWFCANFIFRGQYVYVVYLCTSRKKSCFQLKREIRQLIPI